MAQLDKISASILEHQRIKIADTSAEQNNQPNSLQRLLAPYAPQAARLFAQQEAQNWPLLMRLSQQAQNDQDKIAQASQSALGFDQASPLLLALKRQAMSWMISAQLGSEHQDQTAFIARARTWTDFADHSIHLALNFARHEPRLLRQYPQLDTESDFIPGLFVLGLGKLGGHDLNFSSDVDLVAFFDPKRFFPALAYGRSELGARLMRSMTKILMPNSVGQQVWRVDWRLRPDPSVTDLAISTDAALDYFFFRSAPWRRLAMIKARVVAGDQAAGAAFLDALQPFLWRQTLDFRAKDDVDLIKQKIRADHPDLEPQRQGLVPLESADLFHVKLGRGGIREIEFMVNTLQMVWGGRIPELRCTNTLEALVYIEQNELLEKASELRAAYVFLRLCENAIQMLNDAHSHIIPEQSELQELVAAIMGYEPPQFRAQLYAYRRLVHDLFERFFAHDDKPMGLESTNTAAQTEPAPTQSAPAEPTEPTEPENQVVQTEQKEQAEQREIFDAARLLSDWQASFERYGLPKQAQSNLPALAKRCESLVRNACNPKGVAERLESFIRRLPPGGQYIRLLSEIPHLADDVLLPYARGGEFATLLEQSPHVTDLLIERKGKTYSDRNTMVKAAKRLYSMSYYEDQLEGIRRWVNEQLYLIYLAIDRGEKTPQESEALIAQLAQVALEIANDLVARYLGVAQSPLNILALGKLGMNALPPRSDLDLIFICAQLEDLNFSNKFSARLLTALNRPMRGGKVWEIDTRLRPSGQSGPPTICFESFQNHHLTRAQTWEHLALAHARPVYGNLSPAITEFCSQILERARDQQQCLDDCNRMLSRLRAHRFQQSEAHILSAKLRPGGLMALEYSLSCARLLKTEPALVAQIKPSLDFWRNLQFMIRLYGLEGQDINAIPRSIHDRLTRLFGTELDAQISAHNQAVLTFMRALGLEDTMDAQKQQEPDKEVQWL